MLLFEKLSYNIGSGIADALHLDKNKKDVVTYGAYLMLDTLLGIFMVMLLGAICNLFFQTMIFSITTAILRKYSGGAHSTTSFRCATIGAVVPVCFAFIIENLNSWIQIPQIVIYMMLTFVYAYVMIIKLAPKDSPSKPIVKEDKIKLLKKKSIWTLHIYLFICLFLLIGSYYFKTFQMLKYMALICSGTLWQSFTLTSLGHSVVYIMEAPFRYIKLIGGENQ